MNVQPSIGKIFSKFSIFFLVLLGVSFCANENSSYDMPAAEQEEEIENKVADSLDFISYSSEAINGETVYIPVYSHIYQRNRQTTFNLTTTLSIRNTDLGSPITVSKVYYYDSDGNLVQKYLDEPELLSPLSSISYVVEEEDLRGGVGANFLVIWEADQRVNRPVIEAVIISTSNQQGISFISEGRIIDTLSHNSPSR